MDKEAVGIIREAVTVWRDGRYKFWSAADAAYAQNDADWLATIPLAQQPAAQAVGLTSTDIQRLAVRYGVGLVPALNGSFAATLSESERLVAFTNALLSRAAPSGEADYWKREAVSWRRACEATEKELREARATAPQPSAQQADINATLEELAQTFERHGMKEAARMARGSKPGYPQQAEQPAEEARVTDVTDAMATAFHRALTDAPINADEIKEIKIGLRAALIAAPAAAEAQEPSETGGAGVSADYQRGYEDGQADAQSRHPEGISFNEWYAGLSPQWRKVIEAVDPSAAHSRQAQGGALSDEEILRIVRQDCKTYPWGIGSRRADFLRAVRAILARAASEPRAEGLTDERIEDMWARFYPGLPVPYNFARCIEGAVLAAQKKGA